MRCPNTRNFNGYPAPCSKCDVCRKRHAAGWGFRIALEAERLRSAFFITLTYEKAPRRYQIKEKGKIVGYKETKRNTVDIYHLQKFIKRVRKAQKGTEIKYYGVSEYGDETMRPHYHVILIGIDLLRFIGADQWEKLQRQALLLDGKSHFYVDTWKHGHITIGECTPASVNYTLKYISEGRQIPQYKGDDRQPERSLMSKGMGKCYVENKQLYKIHRMDIERQYVVTNESHKISIPRYLKDRLYDSAERQYMAEIYAQKEIQDVENMGDIERKKYWLKKRKKVEDVGKKNTYQHKGKI